MKKNKILKTTDNSNEYNRIQKKIISDNSNEAICCAPFQGCNGWGRKKYDRSWKQFRKKQWKETGL